MSEPDPNIALVQHFYECYASQDYDAMMTEVLADDVAWRTPGAARCTAGCSETGTAPTRRDRLPLRVDLRRLHLLRHHDRVRPTLHAQRDDAQNKGQVAGQQIFDGLLERLDNEAS